LLTQELMNITFTRRTYLAIAALSVLAEDGGRMGRGDLAERIGTTPSFLSQVMAPLTRSGWVVSERGPGGGYRLSGTAQEARLLDLVEAVEGPSRGSGCVLRPGPCPGPEACRFHEVWSEARQVLIDGLDDALVLETKRGEWK
jgi:Rrf2 family iron-sulfur cluster assembly transcriptional regulator